MIHEAAEYGRPPPLKIGLDQAERRVANRGASRLAHRRWRCVVRRPVAERNGWQTDRERGRVRGNIRQLSQLPLSLRVDETRTNQRPALRQYRPIKGQIDATR